MDKMFFIGKVGGHKKPKVPPPALLTAPTISGTPTEGSTLTRTVGTYSTENPPVTLTGQWDFGPGAVGPWTPLVGETGPTLLLPANQAGYDLYFSYREYAKDAGGGSPRVTRSNAIGPLIFVPVELPDAPVNLVAPVVSGSLEVTQMLSVTVGTWTGADSISRQWQRSPDGVASWSDIVGATSTAYLLDPADETQYIRVRETGTNVSGSTSVNSNVVGPVTAAVVGGNKITQINNRGHIGVLETPFVTPGLPLPEAIPLSISRNGYSTAGVATRYTITTQARFKRYNRLTATSNSQPPLDDQVSFDDNVVVGDLVTQPGFGSVANNSTLVMPVPRMQHVDNDHKIVGNSLTVGACGAALGAREQRFFAVVRHSLSVNGVANGTVADVTTVTPHIYQTGLSVQSYDGVFDLSAIPDGSHVEVDTEGFPWYGDTTAKSKLASTTVGAGLTYPGGFARQYFFKHAALAAARPIAYVHATLGNNTTGVVGYLNDSASQTAASASPFQTVVGALTAISAANNTNHGFSAITGAIVRLKSDITAGDFMNGLSYHRGSSILIEKDPVSFPTGNARINMSVNLGTGTITGIGPMTIADTGYFLTYLAGITIARQGIFYIDAGRWVLIDGSGFINDGEAPTSASRLVDQFGIVWFGDGSVQGTMPGANIFNGASAEIGGFYGARGLRSEGSQINLPETLALGCRFTNGVDFTEAWTTSPPDINGTLDITMYLEGCFCGRLFPGVPWRYSGGATPKQAIVAVNVVLERVTNKMENAYGISSDDQTNSTTKGVLFYGVTQIGYNLAGRGNSFYADVPSDPRLHPFPVYYQSIIARNAWKGVPFLAGEGANPAHLDGAEWYGMGVGRKYNGYIWRNEFPRPVDEFDEFGASMRNIAEGDYGGAYDPSTDFVNWQAAINQVDPGSETSTAGNGDYRVKTTSQWHGIVDESALKYDIEGNLRPATGDTPGAYAAQ